MSKNTAPVAVVPAPVAVVPAPVAGNTVNPNSIRQLVMSALLRGEDTKTITTAIQAAHPTSAAASKSVKHIAWYRAQMRKNGQLPKVGAVAATVAAE